MSHDGSQAALLQDTTPRAMARYLERLRETPARDKLARALALSAQVRGATMADVQRSLPGASRDELAVAFVRRVYGDVLADRLARRYRER
jgi:hypothetical protein